MSPLTNTLLSSAALPWWLSVSLKAALVLAAAWLGAALLRRSAAAARHQVWTLGIVGALSMPLLCWALPSLLSWSPALIGDQGAVAEAMVLTRGELARGLPWAMLSRLFGLLWLVGAALAGVRLARGHRAARRLWREAAPASSLAWDAALADAAASLELARRVPIRRSPTLRSPMTIGVLRPRVLLPEAAEMWSPRRLRAVLLHELGHVRRRDPLIQLAAQVACALYWWNPLAWLAAARLRAEREFACDDLVLTAGIRPSSYAGDLLQVARSLGSGAGEAVGAVAMADPSGTEARLQRILDADVRRRPIGAAARAALGGAALGLSGTLAGIVSPHVDAVLARDVSEDTSRGAAAEALAPRITSNLTVGELYISAEPGPFVLQDGIDLAKVAQEVERHRGELHACYQRRLQADPELAGEVIIHAGIDRNGSVTEQCITTTTIEDRELLTCVNDLLAASSFPGAEGEAVDVSFPFVFDPGR